MEKVWDKRARDVLIFVKCVQSRFSKVMGIIKDLIDQEKYPVEIVAEKPITQILELNN